MLAITLDLDRLTSPKFSTLPYTERESEREREREREERRERK